MRLSADHTSCNQRTVLNSRNPGETTGKAGCVPESRSRDSCVPPPHTHTHTTKAVMGSSTSLPGFCRADPAAAPTFSGCHLCWYCGPLEWHATECFSERTPDTCLEAKSPAWRGVKASWEGDKGFLVAASSGLKPLSQLSSHPCAHQNPMALFVRTLISGLEPIQMTSF